MLYFSNRFYANNEVSKRQHIRFAQIIGIQHVNQRHQPIEAID
jgi:hypothetical protein